VRVMLPLLSRVGASFTELTVMPAVSVAVLKAVLPPLVVTSAVPPLDPLFWSHARKVMPTLTAPLKLGLGTKRTRVLASAASSRAAVADGLPKGVQWAPASVLNCHLPLPL